MYSNPYDPVAGATDEGSNCLFNSACDAILGITDIVAQGFTLASGAVITSADFTQLDWPELAGPTSANWAFYTVSGGLPGTLLVSGAALIDGASNAGVSVILPGDYSMFIDTYSFNIPSIVLGPGSYFFALSTTSDVLGFLAEGQTNSGAAQSINGGPWTAGYAFGGIDGVAVELDSSASGTPEPATLGLFGVGLGVLGLMSRGKAR